MDVSRKSITDLETKLAEAKKAKDEAVAQAEQDAAMGSMQRGSRRTGGAIRARPGGKHMSRESGTAMYF